ncbi:MULTISPECIES: DUF503 domain-containing protein [Oceanobacillus]|uniref:DUF503 domain-containing protein n=1 Tax=Oceanobacillus kimchii TaxID=746691 RepID=A0ABQ5TGP0_9BACI|nr:MULTISPECIES: DUF503 domain-containing protein [Oceanobacillus]MBT2598668.1 DUF503 domain-containing protein [Oceanobacillus sp. ISL-74]MBT2651587.1 DUF503 domain-containing protein [Oceanobacillus sp. ISL-73]MCT1576236.1 DUF503 domain-containing protein [Oceanobacillus kimchii]MCT2135873.1 DUF503 domain-containing protein [Oceanobacillus kimchii]OEH54701.1 hypothetical protein AQ616_13165 [Oceanobacillus sp. E9]
MIVYAEIECMLYDGHSLKDKRSIIKKVISKLRQTSNVSVTELDFHDLWQRTKFGIVSISTDYVHAEKIIQHAIGQIDSFSELERTITNVERL